MRDETLTSHLQPLAIALFIIFMCVGFLKYTIYAHVFYFWIGTQFVSSLFTYILWSIILLLTIISLALVWSAFKSILSKIREILTDNKPVIYFGMARQAIREYFSVFSIISYLQGLFSKPTDPRDQPVTRFMERLFRYLRFALFILVCSFGYFYPQLSYYQKRASDYEKELAQYHEKFGLLTPSGLLAPSGLPTPSPSDVVIPPSALSNDEAQLNDNSANTDELASEPLTPPSDDNVLPSDTPVNTGKVYNLEGKSFWVKLQYYLGMVIGPILLIIIVRLFSLIYEGTLRLLDLAYVRVREWTFSDKSIAE